MANLKIYSKKISTSCYSHISPKRLITTIIGSIVLASASALYAQETIQAMQLAQLEPTLADTGLKAQFSDENTVNLNKNKDPALTLPTMKIESDGDSTSLQYLDKQNTSGALGKKRVLDSPYSIAIIDQVDIQERGAKSLGQIFFNDASFFTSASSYTNVWWGADIRGLSARNFYVDNVPILLHWGSDFPVEAVENVSVLKGSTGFMYGFGQPGGAISYRLKRPTEADETTLNLGYRNPGLFSAHIDTSHNFGDSWGVRFNLANEQGKAYNKSKPDRQLAAVSLEKKFNNSVTWSANILYEKNNLKSEPFQFYVNSLSGKLPSVSYDYDNFNIDNSYYKTETKFISSAIDWDINNIWKLQYQIGFSRKTHESNKSFAYLINTAGDYQGYAYNFAGELDNLYTQLMLQGALQTGSVKHEVVAGLGFERNKTRYGNEFYWSNDFNGNIYHKQNFRITRSPDFSLASLSGDVTQRSLFVSDTLVFNDHWQSIIGLRYTEYDDKSFSSDPDYKIDDVSPTLAVIYKPNSNTSFYASYVEALEAGTRVGPTYTNVGDVLDATVSKQYEIGAKHSYGRLNYTAALFRIKRAKQMDVINSDLSKTLTQDGLVVYDGLELATDFQFTDNLNLGFSTLYLDAIIEKTDNPALKGTDPNTSDWQLVANAAYKVPSIKGLKLHGSVRYFGGFKLSGTDFPSWTIVNTGFTYDLHLANRYMALIGNINNLFNEKYWSSGGDWSETNMGEERNFSVTLSMDF